MSEKNETLSDVKNLLEYAKTLGMDEVEVTATEQNMPKGSQVKAPAYAAELAKTRELKDISSVIGDCERCKLCEGRNNIVFGVGNENADLMFIGEGPGRDEDKQGIPFVGRAGQLLTKIIEAMDLKRDDVYIANIVKCLRYNAMVQLGNGKWERIGRLVKNHYKGTVKSIDSSDNIVNRKVTGWHATALAGRPVYSLSYKSARPAGPYKCAVQLTGDHPVLTERGYIAAQDLKPGDRVATGQGLSKTTKEIILGTLLGDGHIVAKETYLSFSHSAKQAEYAKFKADLLKKELGCKIEHRSVTAGNDIQYPIVKCYTSSHRSLRIIRSDFYKPKKRVPAYFEKTMTPLTVAIWFMDDGYMRIRPKRQPSAEIATCAFLPEDLNILMQALKNLEIPSHIRNNRIHFDVDATKQLSRIIAPYIPSSMRHKLHPDIKSQIKFDRKHYKSPKEKEVLFDEVKIDQIKHSGTDKTFYCIDVEDTNNFITSGGVVHNCRPPNNRNPEPDEVETCIPFLIRQAELIKPKVIVCLGSVATQNLLGTEEKISGLRGNFQKWQGIPVMPTYHPAFLLRNSNMKKPVWEDMQKVMKHMGLS